MMYCSLEVEVNARKDHNTFLGNYSPTPPLNQHFALREKQVRKVSVGVGLGEG